MLMRRLLFLVILMLVVGLAPPGQAAEQSEEYQLKAAYLYNFAKFTHWPDCAFGDANAPFVIGVIGKNDFGHALEPLIGRKIHNRIIEIKYFNSKQKVEDCQLLYVGNSETKRIAKIVKKIAHLPILTVSETSKFVESGGTIQLITKRDRLRFSINLIAVKKHGIRIEAQLLSLAAKVIKEP